MKHTHTNSRPALDIETAPDVSIIIVSFNTRELTRKCLGLVSEHAANVRHEVIVVDNGSSDESSQMIEQEFPEVRLISLNENRGFAGGNNPGIRASRGRYILLLNSDAFLEKNALLNTVSYMDQQTNIGILGCRLTNPDGTLQPSARMLPGPLNKFLTMTGLAHRYSGSKFFGRVDFTWWDHSEPRSVGWVVGAFFLIRREIIEDIGYLDERYFLYYEEVDYCISARRKGWDVVFYPYTGIVHLGGQSAIKSNSEISSKGAQVISIRLSSEYKYYRKNYGLLWVVSCAGLEFFWNMIVLMKNILLKSPNSEIRKTSSILMMKLILKTLKNEHWGKGKRE